MIGRVPISSYYRGEGRSVMASMQARYGAKKGKQVFYATAQKQGQAPATGQGQTARGGQGQQQDVRAALKRRLKRPAGKKQLPPALASHEFKKGQ